MQKCNVCYEAAEHKLVSGITRDGGGAVYECRACGHIFQETNMTLEEIAEYNELEYTKNNKILEGSIKVADLFEEREKTIYKDIENLSPLLQPYMDLLDIGCGAGNLLCGVRDAVRSVSGVELSHEYVSFLKTKNISGYYGFIENIEFENRFDIVTSLNAIDHMPFPAEALKNIKKILKDDGLLYIEVPNMKEALKMYLPEQTRAGYDKFFWHKAHFSYFDEKRIVNLLEFCGFEVEKVMYRHQYGLYNFLHWFFIGGPQANFTGATKNQFFLGNSDFERRANAIFEKCSEQFVQAMQDTKSASIIICVARPK